MKPSMRTAKLAAWGLISCFCGFLPTWVIGQDQNSSTAVPKSGLQLQNDQGEVWAEQIDQRRGGILALTCDPYQNQVAWAGVEPVVVLYDEEQQTKSIPAPTRTYESIFALQFDQTGRFLLAGLIKGGIDYWEVKNVRQGRGSLLLFPVAPTGRDLLPEGHQQRLYALTWWQERSFCSIAADGRLCFWKFQPGVRQIQTYPVSTEPLYCLTLSSKQDRLFLGDGAGKIYCWHLTKQQQEPSWQAHPSAIFALAYLETSQLAAPINSDKRTTATSAVTTSAVTKSAVTKSAVTKSAVTKSANPQSKPTAVLFSAGADHYAKLWSESGELVGQLGPVSEPIQSVLALPANRVLVGFRSGALWLWDWSTGTKDFIHRLPAGVLGLAYLPKIQAIYAGLENGSVWRLKLALMKNNGKTEVKTTPPE